MIRIIDIHKLALVAALTALGAVGCSEQVGDSTSTQDEEVRETMGVTLPTAGGSSTTIGPVPATAAHPTARRLGPQPDPWKKSANGDDEGPQPDPWNTRGGDGNSGSGSSGGAPKPGDPSNPNQ
ncbi:MAG: hypothetical protein JST00_28405 [Deltaproteobacteria bacterium]|nr:hypothetical protein [Deltaproteobacteria bacterium]